MGALLREIPPGPIKGQPNERRDPYDGIEGAFIEHLLFASHCIRFQGYKSEKDTSPAFSRGQSGGTHKHLPRQLHKI